MPANFLLAPPPKIVDGLAAVPIDIKTIDAVFVFDGAASVATADVTITYTVGPYAGNPIFDLRQQITQAWLDGTLFPAAQLGHHSFGTGNYTDLRVIESVQAPDSVHTLRVQYPLAVPDSQLGGSYLPAIEWSAGPRLRFVFGLSDLNRARYAEAWLPANLIFDRFSITLEIRIINTLAAHSVITNGTVNFLGTNHWRILFPERFTALSPMLEVRASDTLVLETGSVTLPVSGRTVAIDAWKPQDSFVDLAAQIGIIRNLLTQNENDYGPFIHERFTAFFNGSGGMEYEGGTTVSTSALSHETFHSWFARGLKPASQADGWWDEGFTTWHEAGADDAVPLDYTDPPVLLCSRDPWQRHTPGNAYSDGASFWMGLASIFGPATLRALMAELYDARKSEPISTATIEEFLLARGGNALVVDAFHRFAYGFSDPSPAPNLWLKDDPAHGGDDIWGGTFWDSPDLWIRNQDDDGLDHQQPEHGQDNWFYARVRNRAGVGMARHFVVTFHSRGFAGTQFVYPDDFLPCIAAKAEFDLPAGESRIVKARWPRALVPPAGTHSCLLASVIARTDHPVAGRHVWEHNNLAQKNLTVVNLLPDMFVVIPVVVGNWFPWVERDFSLEILKSGAGFEPEVSIVHRSKEFFQYGNWDVRAFKLPAAPVPAPPASMTLPLDCGGHITGPSLRDAGALLSDRPERILSRFPGSWEAVARRRTALPIILEQQTQSVIGFRVGVPRNAKAGQSVKIHLVQRCRSNRRIVGGIAVQVNVGRTDANPMLVK